MYNLNISTTSYGLEYFVSFVNNSNALGVFLTLLYKNNEEKIDFNKSIYFMQRREESETVNQLLRVPAGTYQVLAYDVEENGEIFGNLAAYEDVVYVTVSESGKY